MEPAGTVCVMSGPSGRGGLARRGVHLVGAHVVRCRSRRHVKIWIMSASPSNVPAGAIRRGRARNEFTRKVREASAAAPSRTACRRSVSRPRSEGGHQDNAALQKVRSTEIASSSPGEPTGDAMRFSPTGIKVGNARPPDLLLEADSVLSTSASRSGGCSG